MEEDKSLIIKSFEDLGLAKGLCKILAEQGFLTPTDIQSLALPPLLAGQDVIGIAPTGTGKTLAYLLPVFQLVRSGKISATKGPVALIVAPARELAVQVAEVAQSLAAGDESIKIACVYGGAGPTAQRRQLEQQPHIVIGTPGRIREFYLDGTLVLKQIKFLVLDEADRLMDMGFMPQLRAMLEVLPRKRQNLLFSATFNHKVEAASAEFLEWPVRVQAAKQASLPDTILEHFYATPNQATKRNLLLYLIGLAGEEESGFLFCRSRLEANEVQAFLQQKGVRAEVLHANKGQHTRQKALEAFKTGETRWLVTTDVASRGLDVAGVPLVVQYGLPLDIRDYVHRSGRTGRAGQSGVCHTFVDPGDEAHISGLAKLLGRQVPLQQVPAATLVALTPHEERIGYERSKDEIKRAADPTFKGAFHEKKRPGAKAKPALKGDAKSTPARVARQAKSVRKRR